MQVLVIKTSSMGDVIHTLPALTDAARFFPEISFTWVVEENFTEIPAWHKHVSQVIPLGLRRWRKNKLQALRNGEWQDLIKQLRAKDYAKVIDAQGLIKSALLTRLARGERYGLAWSSAREPLASIAYQHTFKIEQKQHAIVRVRELFANALGYPIPTLPPDSGIAKERLPKFSNLSNYIVFLHGTTWANKHWPETYWQELASQVVTQGYRIVLPWGSVVERQRAEKLALLSPNIDVLPKLSLTELAGVLNGARAVVAVDTGLGHLAAALEVPTIGLYGPTDPGLTGSFGPGQIHLATHFSCAPCLKRQCQYSQASNVWPACFSEINPQVVWQRLSQLLTN